MQRTRRQGGKGKVDRAALLMYLRRCGSIHGCGLCRRWRGIGGAALAGLLSRGGKKVVVLERSLVPPQLVRPEILWPHTMELLFSLSPKELWERDAVLGMRE